MGRRGSSEHARQSHSRELIPSEGTGGSTVPIMPANDLRLRRSVCLRDTPRLRAQIHKQPRRGDSHRLDHRRRTRAWGLAFHAPLDGVAVQRLACLVRAACSTAPPWQTRGAQVGARARTARTTKSKLSDVDRRAGRRARLDAARRLFLDRHRQLALDGERELERGVVAQID